MGLFASCMAGKTHTTGLPKQYRVYYNDIQVIRCKCGDFCLIANPHSRIDGEKCERCNTVYKHPKLWTVKCSECQPKGGK